MHETVGANSDAAQRQRLVRMLTDPDTYFAEARREARQRARRLLAERMARLATHW